MSDTVAAEIWPFADPPNVATFMTRNVVERGAPIVHFSHDAETGNSTAPRLQYWQTR